MGQLIKERLFLQSADHLERLLRRYCSASKPYKVPGVQQSSGAWGRERSLTNVWSGQGFCPDWSVGTNKQFNKSFMR